MSSKVLLSLFVSAPLLCSCSSKELYNAVQENRLQQCQTLYGAQREECEAQYQKDYETYKRERSEVINEGK